jgi:hypothetical protein
MSVQVTTKSVQILAVEVGLPESIIERHMDALCQFALTMRERERKKCQNNIRRWYFDRALNKPQLFQILED